MEPPLGQHQEMLMAAPSRNSRLEDMLVCGPKVTPQQEQRNDGNSDKTGNKSQPETSLKCPRCDSTNTKFCYYNNYSLLQPRYFCKSCRRYWTKGGTLRNVPVGGGCRKNNKRLSSSSSSSSSSSTSKRLNPHIDPQFSAIGIEANSIPLINSFPMDTDFSFLGSLGLHSTITNPGATSSSVSIPSFFNSIGYGPFHETRFHDSSFQNSYHKLDNGARQIQGQREEMVAVPKRDITSGSENESRILWGFPWNGNSEDVDFARSGASWNGINSVATNWQGLINSSLM